MSQDAEKELADENMPSMVQLQDEIKALENELHAKLNQLESKWNVRVFGIVRDSNGITLRCEVRNPKLR